LGLLAGYYGGFLDELIGRLTDALLAFPFLILAVALAAALGPSLTNAMIAIGIASAPTFVRLTRGQVLAVRAEDYVQAAVALGASDLRLMTQHVLPNAFAPILVQATLTIAGAIIAESALSFLGLGVQPPTPSWGGMLNVAKNYLVQAPWMAIWPGLSIFVTVLAFNLFGDGLRDALDPRDAM
jgi:peptide/nickel transport system permease protein